jgi:hypothetical protein
MKAFYTYPECSMFGPMAPRTLIFIWAWDASHGAPSGQCEALVEKYPHEVDRVLDEWSEIIAACDTLRAMRARIAARAALAEIEALPKTD